MQVKKIAVACAVACAAMAGSANAAVNSDTKQIIDAAVANGRVVYVSGASAVQKGFSSIVSATFNADEKIAYFADTAKPVNGKDVKYIAVAGTVNSDVSGGWANEKAIIVYRFDGGSVYGVNPVARDELLSTLNVTDATCGSSGAGTFDSPYVCAKADKNTDVGISDVSPKLFKGPYNVEGEGLKLKTELSDAELENLGEIIPLYSLAFGIPVTKTVNPNAVFDKATVAAIMSGSIKNWKTVQGESGGGVIVCRRTPGSGTQAVMNLWAGNFPCSADANVPAARKNGWTDATNTFAIPANPTTNYVIENASSGDVQKCLNSAVTGQAYTTKDRNGDTVNVTFGSANNKAIGVLSMDSLKDSTSTGNWQFRPLNGAGTYTWDNTANDPVPSTDSGLYPTHANLESGAWDMQGWISLNIPTRRIAEEGEAGYGKYQLIKHFATAAQDPAVLADIADLKHVTAAIPGGDYTGENVLDAQYVDGNQCNPFIRVFND